MAIIEVLKYNGGPDVFAWKYPSEELGTWTQLIVNESQEAVLVKEGQSPMHCNGKVLIIDGGFSKAYQEKTGIAGYTLVYNSYGLILAEHEPFESVSKAIEEGNDVVSHKTLVQRVMKRKRVADTDIGKNLKEDIADLEELLKAYREGVIEEDL